jgi:hypothetical protein
MLHRSPVQFLLHYVSRHPSGEGGRLMSTMMSDVTMAIKELPYVSVAAIDGKYLRHCRQHFHSANENSLDHDDHTAFSCVGQGRQLAGALSCVWRAMFAAWAPLPPSGTFPSAQQAGKQTTHRRLLNLTSRNHRRLICILRFVQAERGVTPGWGGARALVSVRRPPVFVQFERS